MTTPSLTPRLTPHGRLVLEPVVGAPPLDLAVAERLRAAFARGSGHGLLHLGAGEVGGTLPAALATFRELGARYVAALCMRPDAAASREPVPPPPDDEIDALARAAPAIPGAEYLSADVLRALWSETDAALRTELAESGEALHDFLKSLHPAWNVVGRVHFNLAENRSDEEAPFAFLATYTGRLSAHGKAQHVPLGQALREYAGAARRPELLSLLVPVQRASQACPWLRRMVDEGEIFHPLRWTPGEAVEMLRDVPALESAGVLVRMPAGWRAGRPPRPRVTATVGAKAPSRLGQEALLDFRMDVTLDGETLTREEIAALLDSSAGLALIRGRWVELDRDRLERALARMEEVQRLAQERGVGFAEAMRMAAGADVTEDAAENGADPEWSQAVAGPWLAETLKALHSPAGLARVDPGSALHGTLRPYQEVGVRWLHLLSSLGLGGCLADDMGLGKTIQILALLATQRAAAAGERAGARRSTGEARRHVPSLLVAPASLLANWSAELVRFTPSLRAVVAHPSEMPAADLAAPAAPPCVAAADLVITSYGSLLRVPWLEATPWRLVVLDEAQAIKNPAAKQTRAAKRLRARARFALTGTPVENRLADLWSIFDFVSPGLLGSAKEFARYAKRLADAPKNPYGPLRELVRPYILRRLKTDRSVITDLPDKTEIVAYCGLGKKQAALYGKAVEELARELEGAEGIRRKGVVLAYLTRFKQICNHPSQWLGDGAWAERDSGKLARLRDLAEVVAEKQEKVLVFTQFREATGPLSSFLAEVFGRPGLVLHGEIAVAKRKDLVARFQEDESVPFFVLSLKAGGTGLNLTAASHVVHFDRWWNPAVESQATDRAFRIGQSRNVLVHKLVCRGTVEDKIHDLIESKRKLAADLLEGGAELDLTSLGDEELLDLVRLDLRTAMKED